MTSNKDFLKLVKSIDPEYDDPIATTGFIDTGSYIFNAALSSSIYGGFADNRISTIHSEAGVGKSYFAMSAVKEFLAKYDNAQCLYFDTEYAMDDSFFDKRGIDADRVHIRQPATIEKFQTEAQKFLSGVKKMSDHPPIMMVLDSLGMLPSNKEFGDAEDGKEVRDMTKQGATRSLFRTLTQDLGKLKIPMIVAGHSYKDIMSYGAPSVLSGGGGIKYASSAIIHLAKSKNQEEMTVNGKKTKVHNGNIIRIKIEKSRFSREGRLVETKLDFQTGIDRYYGLLDLASQYNIIKKVSTQYEMPDGSKHFKKHIDEQPEKYFNAELLGKIEEAAKKHFSLGSGEVDFTLTESELDAIDNGTSSETETID